MPGWVTGRRGLNDWLVVRAEDTNAETGGNVSLLEHALKPGDIVIHTGKAVILGKLPEASVVLAGKETTVWGR